MTVGHRLISCAKDIIPFPYLADNFLLAHNVMSIAILKKIGQGRPSLLQSIKGVSLECSIFPRRNGNDLRYAGIQNYDQAEIGRHWRALFRSARRSPADQSSSRHVVGPFHRHRNFYRSIHRWFAHCLNPSGGDLSRCARCADPLAVHQFYQEVGKASAP